MKLSEEEKYFLSGDAGSATKKAMEILVALGKIFNAQEMVAVKSAQIAGVSYRNIGDPGLDFLKDWIELGAKARIPAFMNPAGIDRRLWRQLGVDEYFAEKQLEIIDCLHNMGIEPTLSCTPYHIGYTPEKYQHIAWSESSAVSYANSVLGARTNREGGPSALASAITGRTPKFGLHVSKNRLPTHEIHINLPIQKPADYGLLGYRIGKRIGNGIPYFKNLELPDQSWKRTTALKNLGAAMAASGAVALYHIHEVTPEARNSNNDISRTGIAIIEIDSLQPAIDQLKHANRKLELVALGCPHCSIEELKNIADYIDGKKLKSPLWITTAFDIREKARDMGISQIIERAGGIVMADTCMVVSPLRELGFKYIAVDSAKAACYLPSHQDAITYWGSTEQCLESAIEGIWKF